jgi:hypothetical protein
VTAQGVVYYERTLGTCGKSELRRWDGRRDSLVLRLPSGTAYQYAYLVGRALYVDLGRCSWNATADIDAFRLP